MRKAKDYEKDYEEDYIEEVKKNLKSDIDRAENYSIVTSEVDDKNNELAFYALSINSISQLTPKINKPKSITNLRISHWNSLISSEGIEKFLNVEILDLSSNQLETFKAYGLVKLIHLNLSWNSLREVPVIKMLTKLQSLDLSHNRISNLNAFQDLSIRSNNQLSDVNLNDNLIWDFQEVVKLK